MGFEDSSHGQCSHGLMMCIMEYTATVRGLQRCLYGTLLDKDQTHHLTTVPYSLPKFVCLFICLLTVEP